MNSLESSAAFFSTVGNARPSVTLRTLLVPPRPLMLLVTVIYLVLLVWLPTSWCAACAPWQRWLVAALVLGLLALDRLDYMWFGTAPPPARSGIALLALRFVLFESIIQIAGLFVPAFTSEDGTAVTRIVEPLPICALLPYFGALYFGAKGAALCGAVVGLEMVARMVAQVPSPGPVELQVMLMVIGNYLMRLAFVAVPSTIVVAARAGRLRAEGLRAELELYGRQRDLYTEQALQLTEDLNHLARAIHEDLNRRLAAIGVLLTAMPGFGDGKVRQAEQTVRESKEAATMALQDVRRSVRMLRTTPALPPVPAAEETPQTEPQLRSWRYVLVPRPFDALIATVYLSNIFLVVSGIALLGQLNNYWAWPFSWPLAAICAAALLVLALDRLDVWLFAGVPPTKVAVVLLALRLLCIPLIAISTGYMSWVTGFVLVIPYRAFVYFGSKIGFALAALTAIGVSSMMIMEAMFVGAPSQAEPVAWFLFNLLVVSVCSHVALTEWNGRERAWKLVGELRAEMEQLRASAAEALSAVQERNHLAREIHDGLGHYLTVINVQLEKALAYREVDPAVADHAVHEASRMTTAALEEVRVSLGSLENSQEGPTLIALVNQLVDNLRSAQQAIEVRIEGSEAGFAKQSLVVLYRAIQEGLTNAQKHAGPGSVQLELTFGTDDATLTLADNGRGFDPAAMNTPNQDGGYGLQGLRERLELAGGRLEVASEIGASTTLTVTVPKRQAGRGT